MTAQASYFVDASGLDHVHTRVLIIGGGPSGLTAAATLSKKLGQGEVLVLEREHAAGGIPRHSDHPGFGIRDRRRFWSGPKYAARLVAMAKKAGARLEVESMVTDWVGPKSVVVTSPRGRYVIDADVIVLATGARERPRSARRIPGDRGQGVFTTGQLQNTVHVNHKVVGERAVIVGAELVSWSAAMTLQEAGTKVVSMVTRYPRVDAYAVFNIFGRLLFRTSVHTSTTVVRVIGKPRVTGVEVLNNKTGKRSVIECDTVVFTGDWIPDHELSRKCGAELDVKSLSPAVDGGFRTSEDGIFAVGNLVHPVDTADIAAIDGSSVADPVLDYLAGKKPSTRHVRLTAQPPLRWISPMIVRERDVRPSRNRLELWTDEYVARPTVTVTQGGRVVSTKRLPWPAAPGRVFRIPADILGGVEFDGATVEIALKG